MSGNIKRRLWQWEIVEVIAAVATHIAIAVMVDTTTRVMGIHIVIVAMVDTTVAVVENDFPLTLAASSVCIITGRTR